MSLSAAEDGEASAAGIIEAPGVSVGSGDAGDASSAGIAETTGVCRCCGGCPGMSLPRASQKLRVYLLPPWEWRRCGRHIGRAQRHTAPGRGTDASVKRNSHHQHMLLLLICHDVFQPFFQFAFAFTHRRRHNTGRQRPCLPRWRAGFLRSLCRWLMFKERITIFVAGQLAVDRSDLPPHQYHQRVEPVQRADEHATNHL